MSAANGAMLLFVFLLVVRCCNASDLSVNQPYRQEESSSLARLGNTFTSPTFWGNAQNPDNADPKPDAEKQDGKETESSLRPYLRWLWWGVVFYCFWAMAEVCDEYFVPTIEVISEKFEIPEDVAGATIMALGCNGPELFINVASLFQKSDLGVGAVVGGEVFNLLVLIGCAVLATPLAYMPLKLSKFSFSREICFYTYSVGLLLWVLNDGIVTFPESVVLLVSGCLYSTTVACSPKLRSMFTRNRNMANPSAKEPIHCGELTCGSSASCANEDPSLTRLEEGCLLKVRVRLENRMNDRCRQWDTRLVSLTDEGLWISTDIKANSAKTGRTARGIVYQHNDVKDGGGWHHGGLINTPSFAHASMTSSTAMSRHDSILLHANSEPTPASEETPWELIPLRDVVSCAASLNPVSRFEVRALQRSDVTTLLRSQIIQLEFEAGSEAIQKLWVSAITVGVKNQMVQVVQQNPRKCESSGHEPKVSAIANWAEWLSFPVRFLLKSTIPDVKDTRLRKWYMVSFLTSMSWLAVFAYSVVQVCFVIHDEFNVPVKVLGFTLAAIGTSFPNVVSCTAVSRQGKTPMAIANALGANIQNVFVALAIPWMFGSALMGPIDVGTLGPAVTLGLLLTLAFTVLLVLMACCTMPRWFGASLLFMYGVYLVLSILEQTHCDRYPFLPCSPKTNA